MIRGAGQLSNADQSRMKEELVITNHRAMRQLDDLAQQMAGCGPAGRSVASVVGRGEANPDTWRVRAMVEPCETGSLEVIIELAASSVARQEGPVERWMVVNAEPAAR